MANMTYRTLTINTSGALKSSTSAMKAYTGDRIAWVVVNESTATVKLKIKDFKKKSNNTSMSPVTFVDDKVTVLPPSGGFPGIGIIFGQVTFLPAGPSGTSVETKYTIDVKSSLFNKDYDPDLEIEKP